MFAVLFSFSFFCMFFFLSKRIAKRVIGSLLALVLSTNNFFFLCEFLHVVVLSNIFCDCIWSYLAVSPSSSCSGCYPATLSSDLACWSCFIGKPIAHQEQVFLFSSLFYFFYFSSYNQNSGSKAPNEIKTLNFNFEHWMSLVFISLLNTYMIFSILNYI